jgi:copper(I)-binding protein
MIQNTLRDGLLAVVLSASLISATHAGDGLSVTDAWIREAPPTSAVHAGYLTVTNNGQDAVSITGVYSPDYGAAEIHRSWVEDGIAHMALIEQLTLAPGETVRLEPGGKHLMLFRPQRALSAGDTVTLRFGTESDDCHEFTATVKRADMHEHSH